MCTQYVFTGWTFDTGAQSPFFMHNNQKINLLYESTLRRNCFFACSNLTTSNWAINHNKPLIEAGNLIVQYHQKPQA